MSTSTEPEERILRANTDQLLPHEQVELELSGQWSGVGLWLRWVLATAAGWLASGFITGFMAGVVGSIDHAAVTGATYLMTPLTYTLQWLVLRPRLARAWRWIPVSVAGEALAFLPWVLLQPVIGPALGPPSVGAAAVVRTFVEGVPAAVAQWLLLRSVARGAWRWLVANLIWVGAFALLNASYSGGGDLEPGLETAFSTAVLAAISGTVLGAFAACVSGIALVSILRRLRGEPAAARS